MDVEGVAEWIQTVLPDKDLAKRYADGLRDGLVDGDTMDTFPMGGDELTDHGIQKKHCRFILAKWAKLTAGEGAGASTDPPVPPLSPHSSEGLQPGVVVDRYEIVRLVHRSDKSKIFVASEEGEEYVLKQLFDSMAFHHEVACLKAVKSKDPTCSHVVKYLRSFQASGNFIVMEAGGETAVQWCESCGLPIAAMLLKIGLDLVNATEFLHTQVGLIHCDIKLSTLVWFAGPKTFKLIDIGAAQKAGEELREYTVNNLPPEAA
jgi:serine/threonine protein kinase